MRMLLNDMKRALDRGVKIRILTGNYLGITQPSALYLIKSELGDRVDLRLYNETSRSFHPKSYIFHYESSNEIYIGSSNISKSALTSGIEWNYRFSDTLDKKNYELFYATFEDLFLNHSIIIDDEELKRYSKAWKKPAVSKDLAKYDATEDGEDRNAENVRMLYRPRGAQIEALYALQESRMEGAAKGLVYAATGIGKTYLAAFDSAKYKRVLFVAHREEILKQAVVSFKNVRNSADYGFFDGKEKDRDKSVIFASVATLGRTEYLNETYFPADYFEYVIIDEFHHAVTDQYRRIVEYFQPQFLLGLTATPERMDGKNIYEICDYNVPYQISLKEAINKGMLVPFHYYGVYDETDYSGLRIVKGRYDEQELNQAYIGNERRYDLIYKYYRKYRSLRAIGFCCSRQHAEDMAKEFCQRGIASAAVYSGENGAYAEERNEAIRKLKNGEIRVIFSVDMFNEGMDIASLDMVMFLRPTESPVVFLQQLGRGLRLYKGKEYLNVLDFIGNYEKAGKAPLLLSGEQSFNKNVLKNYILKINELCYGKASVEFSYLECTYRDLLRNEEENDYSVEEDIFEETLKRYMTEEDLRDIYNDPYKTLKYLARVRLKRYANKHYEVAEDYSSKLLKKTDEEILKILLSENEKLPSRLRIVCASTQKIIRMVLNTVCSYLFNVEVSNHPVLAQNSKKALTYGELRILSFVRNSLFTIEEFRKREILLDDKQNKDTADYSIMKV